MVEILGKMKTLSLKEAEQLKNIIHPGHGDDEAIERYRYLVEVRALYEKGFAVCVPENILWGDFKGKMKDLGAE